MSIVHFLHDSLYDSNGVFINEKNKDYFSHIWNFKN